MTKRCDDTFHIITFGCRSNQYESAAMEEALVRAGWARAASMRNASLCIVNTCAVTHVTEAQCRQMIRRVARENTDGRIVVTGCFAQSAPESVRMLADGIIVLGNIEKDDFAARMGTIRRRGCSCVVVSDISRHRICTTAPCGSFHGRTRALLKIQDGCDSRCAYCIVPSVRGPSRSLPQDEVLRRAERLVSAGFREIVLTGIHVGQYGLDLHPRTRLSDLLHKIAELCASARVRIRLSSLEPNECTADVISVIAGSHCICPHVHIPLQSGDDDVLRAMRRPYTAAAVESLIEQLLREVPEVNIGLDIIAGFPGETERQFENTLALVARNVVGYAHVFPYSRRSGTPAAQLEGQIPDAVKKERAQVLRDAAAAKRQEFYCAQVGKVHDVLVERKVHTNGALRGMTGNYIPVLFQGHSSLVGQAAAVRITAAYEGYAGGVLEDSVESE